MANVFSCQTKQGKKFSGNNYETQLCWEIKNAEKSEKLLKLWKKYKLIWAYFYKSNNRCAR